MQLHLPAQFTRQAWKNGGGVTDEIARADNGPNLLWRLSLAEVAADGAFSAFPGLTRCLTVIEGQGLFLDTTDATLDAGPLTPVTFSGDLPVTGRLKNGPVRDLNLIFDAARIRATVTALAGPQKRRESSRAGGLIGLFCITGPIAVNATNLPRTALAQAPQMDMALGAGASALLIRLSPRHP